MTDASSPALSPRAVRLTAALEDRPGNTISLTDLWAVWAGVDPSSAGRPDRRKELAATIGELAEAAIVSVSATQDQTASPALPTRLTWTPRPATQSAAALARTVAWRPELSWVISARLTVGQVETLRKVNVWLRDHGRATDVAPLRERSLQVLGDEKALDRALTTGLFADGRLALSLLRTFRSHPPLPSRRVGSEPVLLVVENADTFHTLWTLLRDEPGPVGQVAWGAGGAFEASVVSVAGLAGITTIRYFGDLDYDGLRIPHNAHRRALTDNLPAVQAAEGLYELLLAAGVPQLGQPSQPAGSVESVTRWLDDDGPLSRQAAALFASGGRIPQETIGARLLAAAGDWRQSLSP